MKQLLNHHPIQLEREKVHSGHLVLVNRDHPIRLQAQESSLERTCERQLNALLKACNAMDNIVVVSGYRSREEQQQLYETSVLENGVEFTSRYVARPGESEHQTGLAVDVGESSEHVDFICPSFPDHGVCQSFKQLAAEYGFIQRYQEGKEQWTNIACEPWHYRYVGFPHSVIMRQKGLCLEEYTVFVKQFSYDTPYLYTKSNGSVISIYYVAADEDITIVPFINREQHLSGNNKDGFVITAFSEQGSDEHVI
jgi:D-alanyl-D-alanine dipeptidase/carboxypeptidase